MTATPLDRINKPRSYWLVIAVASVVPALLNAFTSYMNSRFIRRVAVDWDSVIFAASIWLIFGALTPIPYLFAHRFPLRREAIVRTILAHLTGALLLCIAWASLGVLLAQVLNLRPPQESYVRYHLSWILINLPWSVFLYSTVLGCIYAFTYYREAREREPKRKRISRRRS